MGDDSQEVFSLKAEKKKIKQAAKQGSQKNKIPLKDYFLFGFVMFIFAMLLQKCKGG